MNPIITASRPKTLACAAVPVTIGSAYAWHLAGAAGFGWLPALLCFLFAFIMQIDANFINDYYDCVKGRDTEQRLGPIRVCQQGLISLPTMRIAIIVTTILACLVGLPLVLYGGIALILVGMACVLFCFLYTVSFAQVGLGDLLVLLFFGIIPCVFTSYVCVLDPLRHFTLMPWNIGVATGLVIDTLLLVNNYRDIENDKATGKTTLVVLVGRRSTELLYLLCVPVALVMVLMEFGFSLTNVALLLVVLLFHVRTWHTMKKIGRGRELNCVLAQASRNILIYGILTAILIFLH